MEKSIRPAATLALSTEFTFACLFSFIDQSVLLALLVGTVIYISPLKGFTAQFYTCGSNYFLSFFIIRVRLKMEQKTGEPGSSQSWKRPLTKYYYTDKELQRILENYDSDFSRDECNTWYPDETEFLEYIMFICSIHFIFIRSADTHQKYIYYKNIHLHICKL